MTIPPNRYRWDFRTGLYYYVLKPDEARAMGHGVPEETDHVRIYNHFIGVHLDPEKVPESAWTA